MTHFYPAEPTGNATYIAKFNRDDIPTLVRNEFLSLRWTAAVLGKSEVTEFALGQVAVLNETALIVTRFDRTKDGAKLRLEDFAQILRKPRGRDIAGKYDASHEQVAEVIKTYSARPEIDLARFFRRLVIFVLIGNCDGHLKNFSLLETPTGLRLSPLYDVVNTALYANYDQSLALSVNGANVQRDNVTRALCCKTSEQEIGLPERAVAQAFVDLRSKVRQSRIDIGPPAGEGPEGFVTRFSEVVSQACLKIFEE